MCTLIERVTIKKSKKRHSCDAWHFVSEDLEALYDDSDYRCKGIDVGDSYERSRVANSGEAWTFKACLPCINMVRSYDIDISGDC